MRHSVYKEFVRLYKITQNKAVEVKDSIKSWAKDKLLAYGLSAAFSYYINKARAKRFVNWVVSPWTLRTFIYTFAYTSFVGKLWMFVEVFLPFLLPVFMVFISINTFVIFVILGTKTILSIFNWMHGDGDRVPKFSV